MDKNLNSILQYITKKLKDVQESADLAWYKSGGWEKERLQSGVLATKGATWTAPEDGMLFIRVGPHGSSATGIYYIKTNDMTEGENGIVHLLCHAGAPASISIPVREGYVYEVSYMSNIESVRIWFFESK